MKDVFIKYNKENRFEILFLTSIIPLVLYSVYKNGILLYTSGYIGFPEIFKTFVFILVPFIFLLIYNKIKNKAYTINISDIKWILISLFIPINTKLYIFIPLIIIFILLDKTFFDKNKFINLSIVFKLILILILFFVDHYDYKNLLEINAAYNFSIMDKFFGRSISGAATSSLFYGIITYIILSFNFYYKKLIPIFASLIYLIVFLIFYFIAPSLLGFYNLSGIFLAFTLLSTDFKFSPYIISSQILYGVVLSILTILFNILTNNYEGVFLAILIASFMSSFFDKIFSQQKPTK